MRKAAVMFALVFGLSLGGCQLLESFFKDKPGGSDASHVSKAVGDLPYGWLVQGAIALGGAIFGGGSVHVHHTRKRKRATPPAPPTTPAV